MASKSANSVSGISGISGEDGDEEYSDDSESESVDLDSDATLLMVHSEILEYGNVNHDTSPVAKGIDAKKNVKTGAKFNSKQPIKRVHSAEQLAKPTKPGIVPVQTKPHKGGQRLVPAKTQSDIELIKLAGLVPPKAQLQKPTARPASKEAVKLFADDTKKSPSNYVKLNTGSKVPPVTPVKKPERMSTKKKKSVDPKIADVKQAEKDRKIPLRPCEKSPGKKNSKRSQRRSKKRSRSARQKSKKRSRKVAKDTPRKPNGTARPAGKK